MIMLGRMLFILICLVLNSPCLGSAAETAGTVLQTAGPYLLLQTETGQRVVRTDKGTAYGNLVGLGALKYGGEQVRVRYDGEVAGVLLATVVTRESEYAASTELTVTSEQVTAGMSGGAILLIDSRSRLEWDEGHLHGAVLTAGSEGLKRLVSEQGRGKKVVFCGSTSSDLRPFTAARLLLATGFTEVRVYAGGVREWRRKGKAVYASPAHLARLLSSGSPFRLIDLREHAPAITLLMAGTEVLPVSSLTRSGVFLPERSYQLPLFLYGEERDQEHAAAQLAGWGYQNDGEVTLLDPSWKEWLGKFTVGSYRPGALPAEEIGFEEFRSIWAGHDPAGAVLLNVKQKRDRDAPAEVHVPLEELPERIAELPKDREIIIYCNYGLRSAVAHRILHQNGVASRFLNRTLLLDGDGNIRPDLD